MKMMNQSNKRLRRKKRLRKKKILAPQLTRSTSKRLKPRPRLRPPNSRLRKNKQHKFKKPEWPTKQK